MCTSWKNSTIIHTVLYFSYELDVPKRARLNTYNNNKSVCDFVFCNSIRFICNSNPKMTIKSFNKLSEKTRTKICYGEFFF